MEKAHQTRHRDIVKQLHKRVENLYTEFISIAHLHDLGIQASQVTLGETGIFNFSPCFFEPQQPGLFDRYPIDPNGEREIPILDDRPSWDRCLKGVLASDEGSRVDEEKVFEYARSGYEDEVRMIRPDDSSRRSDETQLYMDAVISASKLGTDKKYFTLEDLKPKIKRETRRRMGLRCLLGGGIIWRTEDCREDIKMEDPVPHAVLTNWVEFDASLAEDCLTLFELKSIVRFYCKTVSPKNLGKA
ncbi:hypothetical protein PHISCL_07447 [Aspergillus sclerotialis]|uniref:Uncharacterized protein n=1 Tax=Aspergillus sclerotialis TaxID=2070753 RepID=A0A3A2ZAP4_9EURO|nr:hypothetical protein PHISCL_07447 [Aspergillus sclerotialis]